MGQDVSRMSIVMNVERLYFLTNQPKIGLSKEYLKNYNLYNNDALYIDGLISELDVILINPQKFDVNDATYCDMKSFVTCYKQGGINRYFKTLLRSNPDYNELLLI